jgi:hypothetical protein
VLGGYDEAAGDRHGPLPPAGEALQRTLCRWQPKQPLQHRHIVAWPRPSTTLSAPCTSTLPQVPCMYIMLIYVCVYGRTHLWQATLQTRCRGATASPRQCPRPPPARPSRPARSAWGQTRPWGSGRTGACAHQRHPSVRGRGGRKRRAGVARTYTTTAGGIARRGPAGRMHRYERAKGN